MTNKSIGNFLSELRKEKGLTQKEVADFLNVSDKTVSHWECDKYSPDISMIPVLAEFFGVTCDEILKGEKKLTSYDEIIEEQPTDPDEIPDGDTAENAYSQQSLNENNFSYDPLTKEWEYAKYARIRLHNAFSRRKLTNVIAVFTAIVLWAVSYTVIQLIEHKIGIHNFELYAAIGSAFFSAAVGAIIVLSSHLKFMSMVNMCPFEEVEFIKWRRMARSIIIVPLAIFVLMCIIAVFVFMPLNELPLVETETMPVPESYVEVDPSVVVSGDVIASLRDESNIQEGYISGEVIISSAD